MTARVLPTTDLTLASLSALAPGIGRPGYERDALTPGIVHFGPGNFHRCHQGIYLNALMNDGQDLDWAVTGASVMAGDASLRGKLLAQDLLTTVVAQSAGDSEANVTAVMVDYLPVADTPAILKALADPCIRIVSMTITEGGYFVDGKSGAFDVTDESIQHDIANPEQPRTVFGLIVRSLRQRRENGSGPFTVLSCDNLPHNGAVAKAAVIGLASEIDSDLAQWIETEVSFPSGMVDRIAPATGERELRLVQDDFGIDDQVPVFCEDYLQWVLEDDFVAGRPALERVGGQFVDDIEPFETMKIRILNGGHALIAYAAGLLDIEFASDAMCDPQVAGFLDRVERDEILPVVPPVPGTDLNQYLELIKSRFANPNIGDTIRRLCLDGSNRQPKFIVPTLRDQITAGGTLDGLALSCALWCRYCYGETDSGAVIEPNDPSWDRLTQVAAQARQTPAAWLAMTDTYGDLADNENFSAKFDQWLDMLWRAGTRETLSVYVNSN